MSNEHTHANESIDVEPRTRRALEEPLSVVSLDGTPVESTDETVVMVVSGSGESYHVDADVGRCECPDHKHRNAECKHIRRSRAALGTDPVDSRTLAAVDVDSQLAANAPGPVVATSDGGIIEAGDDGEILNDDSDDSDDDEDDGGVDPDVREHVEEHGSHNYAGVSYLPEADE
jgi:predicted nucleic acid-binding Zn finger protein